MAGPRGEGDKKGNRRGPIPRITEPRAKRKRPKEEEKVDPRTKILEEGREDAAGEKKWMHKRRKKKGQSALTKEPAHVMEGEGGKGKNRNTTKWSNHQRK